MTSNEELLTLIRAEIAGKELQFRGKNNVTPRSWTRKTGGNWNTVIYEYRIKPEPRRRWVNDYPDGGLWTNLYLTEDAAKAGVGPDKDVKQVEFIEVLK